MSVLRGVNVWRTESWAHPRPQPGRPSALEPLHLPGSVNNTSWRRNLKQKIKYFTKNAHWTCFLPEATTTCKQNVLIIHDKFRWKIYQIMHSYSKKKLLTEAWKRDTFHEIWKTPYLGGNYIRLSIRKEEIIGWDTFHEICIGFSHSNRIFHWTNTRIDYFQKYACAIWRIYYVIFFSLLTGSMNSNFLSAKKIDSPNNSSSGKCTLDFPNKFPIPCTVCNQLLKHKTKTLGIKDLVLRRGRVSEKHLKYGNCLNNQFYICKEI